MNYLTPESGSQNLTITEGLSFVPPTANYYTLRTHEENSLQKHLEHSLNAIKQFRFLKKNWDKNGSKNPKEGAISNSIQLIKSVFELDIASTLSLYKPAIGVSELGEIVFEWWFGNKKLTIYVSDRDVMYIKVPSKEIYEMEDGVIDDNEDMFALFSWLLP